MPGKSALLFAAVLLLVCLLTGCASRLREVETYRRAGITAMQEGDYTGAAEQFQKAVSYYGTARQDSAGIDVLRYLAEAQYRSGDYAGAAETYERLLNADGRKGSYLDMNCVCLVKAGGDLTKAVSLYEEADQAGSADSSHQDALFVLGEALASSGDDAQREKARSLYEQAISNWGETPELCSRIGMFCFKSGDLENAEAYLEKGISAAESELGEAELSEERAAELKETLKSLRFNRAVCLEYDRNYAEALREMESIAEEYGADDAALAHEIAFLKSRVTGENSE